MLSLDFHLAINNQHVYFFFWRKLIKSKWLRPQFQSQIHKIWFMHVGIASSPPGLGNTLFVCIERRLVAGDQWLHLSQKAVRARKSLDWGFLLWPVVLQEWPPPRQPRSGSASAWTLLVILLDCQYGAWRSRNTEPHGNLALSLRLRRWEAGTQCPVV